MSAMIRAEGVEFDVDAFLATSSLKPTRVFRKDEPVSARRPDGPRNASTRFNVSASDAGFDEFPRQIDEATVFLRDYGSEIERLVSYPGVASVGLDFGVFWRDVPIHCDYLPVELLRLAGELGLDIEISHYPTGDDNTD
jgi:hypothetical protein